MIWLVALDTNGTLPANDLEFLLQHADDRPLYVVLNKADLLSTLQDVIEEIRCTWRTAASSTRVSAPTVPRSARNCCMSKSLSEVMQEWDHSADAALMLYKEFETMVRDPG